MPALIRVGHGGAPALAAANTLASFDAAVAVGVDMIEFDVLRGRGPRVGLYVAHDQRALERAPALTLSAALAHLASAPFAGVRLQLDIKQRELERDVCDALDESGTRARAFISTGDRGVLSRFRALAPEIPLGWTLGDVPFGSRLVAPALVRQYLDALTVAATALIRAREIDAIVPHRRIVAARLIDAVGAAGGESYAWTVDDAATIARLAALGVTGVITNDPRLFAAIRQSEAL